MLILLFSSGTLFAQETESIQNEDVTVQYERSLKTVAKEVVRIYPSVRRELEDTIKWKIDFRPLIVLIKDRETFHEITGSGPVVAVAISKGYLIIIDNSKMKTHPFTLEITLKHELCHLLLHHYIPEGNLPRWLNEGVSQWASDGIAEILIGENKDLLKQATLSNRFIRIDDLTHGFPADIKHLLLAYQECKSFVEYIIKDFGTDGLLQTLNTLRQGTGIKNALRKTLSISIYELESKWHSHLRTKYTWFTYLSSHLYQILFSLAALAMVYGFIRFLIMKKTYKDDEDYIDE